MSTPTLDRARGRPVRREDAPESRDYRGEPIGGRATDARFLRRPPRNCDSCGRSRGATCGAVAGRLSCAARMAGDASGTEAPSPRAPAPPTRRGAPGRGRDGARARLPLTLASTLTAIALVGLALAPSTAVARNPEEPETAPKAGNDLTFLNHDGPGPFWIGAEVNSIFQYHPSFSAPYSGTNSLRPESECGDLGPVHGLPRLHPLSHDRADPRPGDGARRRALAGAGGRGVSQPRRGAKPDAGPRPLCRARPDPSDHPAVRRLGSQRRPRADLLDAVRAAAPAGVSLRQDVDRRSVRHQPRRLRQPPAIHELDRRQQRRVRLRRRHARLHLRPGQSSIRARASRSASARC